MARDISGAILVMFLAMTICGCSTTIAKDTKLALKGPKAEVSRKF